MGHQHHFLSRLDRVSLPHVELALSLYRDPDLVRFVIANVRLPDAAERVAVSLEHPERGPFLVVTRDGRFVTCLGEGMSPGELPIITRGQLDGITAKSSDIRGRMEGYQKLAAQAGGFGQLARRLYNAADELSREELVALSALQPLYPFAIFKHYVGLAAELTSARDLLVKQLRKSDNLKPRFREMLRDYWNTAWMLGHMAVLAAMDGRSVIDALPEPVKDALFASSYSWPAVRQGVVALAVRGVWGAARIGKALLPTYKRLYAGAASKLTVLDHGMSLAAIGLRHTRLGAEVQKAIAAGPAVDRTTPQGTFVGAVADVLRRSTEDIVASPEEYTEIQRAHGAHCAVLLTRDVPKDSRFRFERPEDVPEDLAMTLAVNVGWSFLDDATALAHMIACLPWIARAAPESLYLPGDFVRAIHVPWRQELALGMLRSYRDQYGKPGAPRRPEGPARKGPCPCGSGKKYKRCCGAAGDPGAADDE
jgi:hypothetical protein